MKRVEDLKVDELKRYLGALKRQGRKNAVQTGKKADLQQRLARIAKNVGIPDRANWNAELEKRGGAGKAEAPKGVKTRAGAALEKAQKERNEALAERNAAKKELEAAKRALVLKTEECEGIARNRNAWAAKAQQNTRKPVKLEIPRSYVAPVPRRVDQRLAPKKYFFDDPVAKARARHEMARAQREWIEDDKMRRLQNAAAYRNYVRARKAAQNAPLPMSNGSFMSGSSAKAASTRRPAHVEKKHRRDIRERDHEKRERRAAAARREAAARASRAALERALMRARENAKKSARGTKRHAMKSASGQRTAKRRL